MRAAAQQAVATDGLIELRSMLPPLNAYYVGRTGEPTVDVSTTPGAFERLRGRRVLRWQACEMALREAADGAPEFEVEGLPVLQLTILQLVLDDGPATVEVWQDDDEWALSTERREVHLSLSSAGDPYRMSPPERSIYRDRELPGLPSGVISRVDVRINDRFNVAEVVIAFQNGEEVLLVAGEGYEEHDGRIRFRRDDESVLLFRHPDHAKQLEWFP